MKNPLIKEKELECIKEACQKIEEAVKLHDVSDPRDAEKLTQVERVHTLIYLDKIKDLVNSVRIINDLINLSEEELIPLMTDDGKMSLDELEKNLMAVMMLDMMGITI